MRLPASRVLENIGKGNLSSGYLLLGKELYWRDRIWQALRHAVGLEIGSLGLAELDLRQDTVEAVLEKASTQNLWALRQLILVRNAQALTARELRVQQQAPTPLVAYFRKPNPSTILVFEMSDVDLETDDWREKEKANSRLETFGNLCDVVLLVSPTFDEAMELIQQQAGEWGRKISPEAAEQLVAAFDRNMARIRWELEKLCLYNLEKEQIEVEDLDLMIGGLPGNTDLHLTEAIGFGDTARALAVVGEVLRSGKYPPLVLSEVARYLRQMILIKESKAGDARQASKVLWEARLPAPQRSVQGFVRQAANFQRKSLVHGLQLAFEADLSLRSNPPDERTVLERFVLELMKPFRSRRQ